MHASALVGAAQALLVGVEAGGACKAPAGVRLDVLLAVDADAPVVEAWVVRPVGRAALVEALPEAPVVVGRVAVGLHAAVGAAVRGLGARVAKARGPGAALGFADVNVVQPGRIQIGLCVGVVLEVLGGGGVAVDLLVRLGVATESSHRLRATLRNPTRSLVAALTRRYCRCPRPTRNSCRLHQHVRWMYSRRFLRRPVSRSSVPCR